jgi:DNA-binding CsgD family transcriptional regulator
MTNQPTAAGEPVRGRPAPKLGPRYLAVLRLCANGRTNAQIAHTLGLSVHTVTGYWKDIRSLLGVQSAPHAVAVALRTGLLRPGDVAVPSYEARVGVQVPLESREPLPGAPGATGGPR